MTLIELLVVIIILTTIVAAAIPLLSPTNDDRRTREATRGLNTFITGAQARAIALNRPFGIALKRLSQDTKNLEDNGVCLEVFYVEQPAPYAGFDANSRASVAIHPDPARRGLVIVRFMTRTSGNAGSGLPRGWGIDLFPTGMVRPGDVIEIAGTRFELLALNDTYRNININNDTGYFEPINSNQIAQIIARPINNTGQQINPKYDHDGDDLQSQKPNNAPRPEPYWTDGASYKILRQVTPAPDEPYQLPEGTAIDLRASGVGAADYFYVPGINDPNPNLPSHYHQVIIIFTPEGRVARVAYSQEPAASNEPSAFDQPVAENIFLLVGKREKVPAPVVGSDPTLNSALWNAATTDEARDKLRQPLNWLNSTSRWVVIGSQSGRIATIENALVDMGQQFTLNLTSGSPASEDSEEMRNLQLIAAREFTREMSQLGGR